MINRNIVPLVGLVLLVCCCGTVAFGYWTAANRLSTQSYLALQDYDSGNVLTMLFTFFLLNAQFIPVSLYVSMKFARTLQQARACVVAWRCGGA